MSFLSVLQGIAHGAEEAIEVAAKAGVALQPEISAINPLVGLISGALGKAVINAQATGDPGVQKKSSATSWIMLGMTLAFEIEGKDIPAEVQADIGAAIDGLIEAVNKLNSVGTAVQTLKQAAAK